jgi:threonine dehydratase
LRLPPERISGGVVAYSSGNHAQAVAIAARFAGVPATIVMPDDAPPAKRQATEGYGAKVIVYDRLRENREEIGGRIAAETGAVLVPPYDHPAIIAGQGTSALEFLEDVPELDALVAPIGGGGLLAGCAICAAAMRPGIRIFGVEPENANDTYLSFKKGERVAIAPPSTIADGLRAPQPGAVTFPILQRHLESVVLVSDDEIREAVFFLLTRVKIVAEASGAASVAAVLFRKLPPGLRNVGVIVSGGNADFDVLLGRR